MYRLFVLLFKMLTIILQEIFDKYYKSLVEIKDFNVLMDNKPFFHQPGKNKRSV